MTASTDEQCVPVPVGLVRSAAALLEVAGRANTAGDLLALLPQPTLTAEHVEDWTDAQPNEGPGCSCGFNGSFQDCAAWRAADVEPPRIEDMAPGTTFTGTTRQGFTQRFERVSRGRVRAENGTLWSPLDYRGRDRIDPSTIRDVTPPAVGR